MENKAEEQRRVYTIPEVGEILGINRNLAYQLVRTGEIPAIRLGKRLVCPKAALHRMLDEQVSTDSNSPIYECVD